MMFRMLFICILLLAGTAWAGEGDGGTQSPFSFGAGARELGLGSAGVSTCDATVAPFWNPSRLATAEHLELGGFYTALYGDQVSYQYLGVAFPTLDYGTLGIGVFRLGVGGIEERDASNLQTGTFDDNRLGLYFAYAKPISAYNFGVALSLEHQSVAGYSATSSPGVHVSVGRSIALPSHLFSQLDLALNLRNVVSPSTKLLEEAVDYPFGAQLAASLSMTPDATGSHDLVVSTAVGKAESSNSTVDAGLEYCFDDLLKLRGGLHDGRLSCGGGISYSGFSFDYALVQRDLGSMHLFSLTTAFGNSVEDRKRQRAEKREAEFQRLMAEQLGRRNRDMAQNYLQNGKAYLNQHELDSALSAFDRALFLARSSQVDTTEVAQLLADTRRMLEVSSRQVLVGQYLDSARSQLSLQAPVQAQYFARLALQADSTSEEAVALLNKATALVVEARQQDQFVAQRLAAIDSLLTFGHIDVASEMLRGLGNIGAENPVFLQLSRRVRFEQLFSKARNYAERQELSLARSFADSALGVFPGHAECSQLRVRCQQTLSDQTTPKLSPKQINTSPVLTEAVRRQVEDAYSKGQQQFKLGDLSAALAQWEQVERLSPNYKQVREYLLNCYKFLGVEMYGQNRLDEAAAYWSKGAALDPANREIGSYLARVKNEMLKLKALSYESE